MPHARVTSKGQVTIPKDVRDALGLREGDALAFVLGEDHAVLWPVPQRSLRELHAALPVTRPFPGRDEERQEVRLERGRRLEEDEGA